MTSPAENGIGYCRTGLPGTWGFTTSSMGIDRENIILYMVVSPCDARGNIPKFV